MNKIIKNEPRSRITLSSVFPFFSSEMELGFIESVIKSECLLHEECTIPASVIINDERIAALAIKNIALFEAGVIKISLRKSSQDLVTLAEIKGKYKLTHLPYLQEKSTFVRFNEVNAADKYKDFVSSYLVRMRLEAENAEAEDVWSKALDDIAKIEGGFTFDKLMLCSPKPAEMAQKFDAAAKVFYCRSGAENVNGDFEVPETVWRHLGANNFKSIDENIRPNLLSYSHGRVLNHFAFSMDQLFRLPAEELVELKREGNTKSTIRLLKSLIASFDDSSVSLAEIEECQSEIRQAISDKCQDEAVLRNRLENALVVADDILPMGAEIIGSGLPMWGSLKKISLNVGRALSKKTGYDKFDFSHTPVQTYVSRIQGAIAMTPSA